jgi:hypothetical protein
MERKEKIGSFRESHHNLLRKLLEVNYFFYKIQLKVLA